MGDSTHADFPAALCRAQRKVEQWRQQRRPRARIPEELWRQAAQLACAYGINRVTVHRCAGTSKSRQHSAIGSQPSGPKRSVAARVPRARHDKLKADR